MAQVYWLIPSMIPLAPRATKPNVTCLPYAMTPRVSPTRSKIGAWHAQRTTMGPVACGRQLGVLNLRVMMISGPRSGFFFGVFFVPWIRQSLFLVILEDPSAAWREIAKASWGIFESIPEHLPFIFDARSDLWCHCHAVLLCLCR